VAARTLHCPHMQDVQTRGRPHGAPRPHCNVSGYSAGPNGRTGQGGDDGHAAHSEGYLQERPAPRAPELRSQAQTEHQPRRSAQASCRNDLLHGPKAHGCKAQHEQSEPANQQRSAAAGAGSQGGAPLHSPELGGRQRHVGHRIVVCVHGEALDACGRARTRVSSAPAPPICAQLTWRRGGCSACRARRATPRGCA